MSSVQFPPDANVSVSEEFKEVYAGDSSFNVGSVVHFLTNKTSPAMGYEEATMIHEPKDK